MKLNNSQIALFSKIGQRATFGLSTYEIAKKNNNLIVLTSDVSTSAGLDRLKSNLKSQFIDVGISEQDLIGVSSGLSFVGYDVVATSFAPFITTRCLEQIKINLGYMKNKVILVGLASGISLGNLGFTHCCIEDISLIRSIPNISIISPCDCSEVAKAVSAAIEHKNSVYIRLTGDKESEQINKKDYKFQIGKNIELIKGKDLMILATGSIVSLALSVSSKLHKLGIQAGVTNVHTLKPIDEKNIIKVFKEYKNVATLEEHSEIGGLSSIISDLKNKHDIKKKHTTFALPSNYFSGGDYRDLLNINGLSESKIIKKLKNIL
tara:strand:- start:1004 stop:1966 length:963 start_codon:yes stop_codon:yes gene_type:complete